MKKTRAIRHSCGFVTLLCVVLATHAQSEAAPALPSLKTLVEKAVTREKLFDDIDANFTTDVYYPGKAAPVIKRSCRWIRHGNRAFIDWQSRNYLVSDKEIFSHIKMSYDGKSARSLFAHTMTGQVFRDWKKYVERGHYEGPDVMGITLPMVPGESVVSLLKGGPVLSPAMLKRINRSVEITGTEEVDGVSCVVVDIITSDSPARQELVRLHLAEQYDYCVVQIQFSFVRDGTPSLNSRVRMDQFQQIKEGFWYPTEARYDMFQGQQNPQATMIYKATRISWPDHFDESLFCLEFPPGTHVFDTIVGIDYVAGGGSVNPDGVDRFPAVPSAVDSENGGSVGHEEGSAAHSAEGNVPDVGHRSGVAGRISPTEGGEITSSRASRFPSRAIAAVGAVLLIVVILAVLAKRRHQTMAN